MPPLRSIPAAKPVKTERTHEENQERFVPPFFCVQEVAINMTSGHISLLHAAVTVVSRLESSLLVVLLRSTRDAQEDRFA